MGEIILPHFHKINNMAKQAAVVKDVPQNKIVRKPTGKKIFSMDDFKAKTGTEFVPDKPMSWIPLSPAMQEVTGLPGFAKGYVNEVRGFSNTGKSTALCEGIVSAQKLGLVPIIIDTENNLGKDRLEKMGFDWSGDYILIDNEYLVNHFGILQDKDRKEAAIEDMGKCMNFFIDLQEKGELPRELVFFIDSIGTLNCIKTINALEKDTSDNNMWNAGANEKTFMAILNNTIPSSRKSNKEFTNTIVATQKIWYDSMNKVIKHKGGESWFFATRLLYHYGGILSHGTRKMKATSKKREVGFGIEVNVNVNKNQVEGPLGGISMEGKIISTPHGFITPEGFDAYKKEHILFFRNLLGDESLTVDDFDAKAYDMDANGKTFGEVGFNPNSVIYDDDDIDDQYPNGIRPNENFDENS